MRGNHDGFVGTSLYEVFNRNLIADEGIFLKFGGNGNLVGVKQGMHYT